MAENYVLETDTPGVINNTIHGTLKGDTLHDVATTTFAGFMSASDKTKLDGIPSGGGLIQTKFVEITTDTTTTSITFVTLLSTTITMSASGILIVRFLSSVSNSNSNNITYARIQVNDTTYRGGAVTAQGNNRSSAICIQQRITGLGAGTHTVTVQWRVSGGTGRVRVATQPDSESASLILEEVTV